MKRYLILSMALIFLSQGCEAQTMKTTDQRLKWDVASVIVYFAEDTDALSPEADLQKNKFMKIEDPSLSELFSKAIFKKLKEDERILYKSDYRVIIVKLKDGQEIRIVPMNHGGLFTIIAPKWERGYFYFKGDAEIKWQDLFFGKA